MIDFIILGAALLTGFLTKLTDLIEDDGLKLFRFDNLVLGALYGLLIAFVIIKSEVVAPLWLGVVIGLCITRKIDAPSHLLGVIVIFASLMMLWNFQTTPLLALFVLACVADEWLSDLADRKKIKIKLLKKFLLLRPIVEITAFVVSLITMQWLLWFAILCFDIGYILTNKFIKK